MKNNGHTKKQLLEQIDTLQGRLRSFEKTAATRGRTEDALSASKNNLSAILENNADGIVIVDAGGEVLYVNPAAEKLFGKSRKDFLGYPFGFPVSADKAKDSLVIRKGNELCEAELRVVQVQWHGRPAFQLSVRDSTERKQAERALQESEAFNRSILESVGEGFIVIDRNYRILSANRAFYDKENVARTAGVGKACYLCSHHIDKPCFEAGEECAPKHTFETGQPYMTLHVHKDDEGHTRYVETKSFPMKDEFGRVTSVIETFNDITETKRLEEQLRQSQKMEAVGQLAGGVAHDFNNILTAIMGYGSLLLMKLSPEDPLRHNVDQILQSTTRAAHLTQSLLAFSRKQVLNPQPVDLNETVRMVERFLHRLIGENITFDLHLDPDAVWVMADHSQIEQVLMNLATNARDVMTDGGVLSIETGRIRLNEEFIAEFGNGKAGEYALLSVSDTGSGMDQKTRKRIFEPFFTTKEVGKGTGLGLSIVYGIIKQHGGFITVYSEPGKGTAFKIYLPLINAGEKNDQPEKIMAPARGTETVLLAEDDAAARMLTVLVLEQFGYQVIVAEDGEEAVEKFIANQDRIKLVILDVIMPKKNAREAYEEIRKIAPDVKTLFMSGYTADIIHKQGVLDEGLDFLSKPASPTVFLNKVREVLDR